MFLFKSNKMAKVNFLYPTSIEDLGNIGVRYRRHPGPYAIGEKGLSKIFPGIENIKINPFYGEHIKGDSDPQNIRLLDKLIKYLQPKNIVEVGTFRGKTTLNLALHSPLEAKVVTIDLPEERAREESNYYGADAFYFQPKEKIGEVYKNSDVKSKINQIWGSCTNPRCGPAIDKLFNEEQIDFAFVDAAHDYDTTKFNFEKLILPRLKPEGVMVIDDYGNFFTHIGVIHFLSRKAHDEGYVFYHYAPAPETGDRSTCIIFLNIPETKNYDWKNSN